jgi:hypothetical protein
MDEQDFFTAKNSEDAKRGAERMENGEWQPAKHADSMGNEGVQALVWFERHPKGWTPNMKAFKP